MRALMIGLFSWLLVSPILAGEPIAREYGARLQSVIERHHPDAEVQEEPGYLVYRFHTQVFKIHTILKTGHISEKAHDEEGPNVDGILVKLSRHDGRYAGAAEVPQVVRRPYWKTFINAYPVREGQYLFLSMSYGRRADKELLEALKTCFDPILPPGQATKNQATGNAQRRSGANGEDAAAQLEVPYSENDSAEAPGARWDPAIRTWIVPPGTDPKPQSLGPAAPPLWGSLPSARPTGAPAGRLPGV